MKSLLLGGAFLLVSSVAATADVSVAPSMGPSVLFHEAEMDENNCHTAKRKRHNFHCHGEVEIQEEVDVTEVPAGDTKVASASE